MSISINTSSYIANRLSYDLSGDFPIMNVVAKNGKFQIRKSNVITSVLKDDTIMNDLPELQEDIMLNIRKIPFHVFEIMGSFFKKIYEKDKTESSLMLFYNKENDIFHIWPPSQKNSGSNSHYLREDDPAFVKMDQANILVMVAHSHPWPSNTAPGPSGTDNNDEKESILYLIMSNVSNIPTYTLSTCPNGKRKYLRFQDVFELPISALTREEKLKAIEPELSRDIIGSVFLKNCSDEELDIVFTDIVDAKEIVERSYKHYTEKIPDNWLKRCTVAYTYNNSYYNRDYPYNNYNRNYAYDNYNWKNDGRPTKEIAKDVENLLDQTDKNVITEDDELYEQYKNAVAKDEVNYDNYY